LQNFSASALQGLSPCCALAAPAANNINTAALSKVVFIFFLLLPPL
jgi:hypothetical protein